MGWSAKKSLPRKEHPPVFKKQSKLHRSTKTMDGWMVGWWGGWIATIHRYIVMSNTYYDMSCFQCCTKRIMPGM